MNTVTSPSSASADSFRRAWWLFELLSINSWGFYGLVLSISALALGGSRMMALLFVCATYLVCWLPSHLTARNEPQKGNIDSSGGTLWGIFAGLSGFFGAFCLVLSLSQGRGVVMLTMPLVFAAAPLVNVFYSLLLKRYPGGTWAIPNLFFGLGVGVIAFAAYWVLKKRPMPANLVTAVSNSAWFWYALGTALFWGTYGPHNLKSMQKFGGSPARTLRCVCLTYGVCGAIAAIWFLDTAIVSTKGIVFGLIAGLLGYGGAVGVAYANRAGMRMQPQRGPIINMPLIFGFASVVSVFASILHSAPQNWGFLPSFLFALVLLISGMVLILKNNPAH